MASFEIDPAKVNLAIFYYLHDKGLKRSGSAFLKEVPAGIRPADGNVVPADVLVRLFEKGIQLLRIEANQTAGGEGRDSIPFDSWELIIESTADLQKKSVDMNRNQQEARETKLNEEKAGASSHVKDTEEKTGKKKISYAGIPPPQLDRLLTLLSDIGEVTSPKELNVVLYKHFVDSGFGRTKLAFCNEVGTSEIRSKGHLVPSGSLVRFMEKGLELLEMEANQSDDGSYTGEAFVKLDKNDLMMKRLSELKRIVKEKRSEKEEAGKN